MSAFYLVRHGETAWNRIGRHQGHGDSPLTLRSIAQARAVAEKLRDLFAAEPAVPQVCCSPLFRTRQTCAILCDVLGFDYDAVEFDDRLRERNYGRWEGLDDAEIQAAFPAEWAARAADRWHHEIEGGERYVDVAARIEAWLAESRDAGPRLIVAHGAMGKVMRGLYAGLSPIEILALDEPHTQIYRLFKGEVTPYDAEES